MEPQLTDGQALTVIALALLWGISTLIHVYGIYVSFLKKWYLGAAALLIPGFALVVGLFKIFKKDILT